MKVFLTREIPEAGINLLEKKGFEVFVYKKDKPITRKEFMRGIKDCDAVIPLLTEKIDKEAIDHVDFLWLDMQGHELAVLKASPRMLNSARAIHTEVSLKETYRGVPLYPEFRHWMENKGFKVVREALPWPDMGNVLFVNRSWDGRH